MLRLLVFPGTGIDLPVNCVVEVRLQGSLCLSQASIQRLQLLYKVICALIHSLHMQGLRLEKAWRVASLSCESST